MKRKTDNFNKFFNRKRNSAVKEEFRQEKKAAKKERKEGIERRFEEKRQAKALRQPPSDDRPARNARPPAGRSGPEKPASRPGSPAYGPAKSSGPAPKGPGSSAKAPAGRPDPANIPTGAPQSEHRGDLIPLNKYISHGGICSRRDAAELIRLGKVMVNGQPVTEPGTKVAPSDLVKVNGKKVTISRNFVYILLNKPKDYITTTDDPLGRKTVLDLIRHATEERVFPVGRLDRNTSGVLLLTNDGDLSQKLAHPSHEIKKIYHVVLDKPLTKADFDTIIAGEVLLEDGAAIVDAMAYEDAADRTQIGIEIHSGRNRIVRRIFEHLGYDVRGLDRVMYAGLTKKNVQRGKWRLLVEKEVRILKYLNSSIKGSAARAKDWDAAQSATSGKHGSQSGSATGSKHGSQSGNKHADAHPGPGRRPASVLPQENVLDDPEGLLSEAETAHFSKNKKRGFSPYTKRPAKGKFRKEDSDRPAPSGKPAFHDKAPGKRPRSSGSDRPAPGGKPSFRDRDKAPGDKPAFRGKPSFRDKAPGDKAPDRPASRGSVPRNGKSRTDSRGPGSKSRPHNAPGGKTKGSRPGGAPRSNRKEK